MFGHLPEYEAIFSIRGEPEFNDLALEIFHYQYHHTEVYGRFCRALGRKPGEIRHYSDIPFLPVEFFRTERVIARGREVRQVFYSSGTGTGLRSMHHLADPALYEMSFSKGFRLFYGDPQDCIILALLPSYMEQQHSSLVYMTGSLIRQTGHPASGFYHHDPGALAGIIREYATSPRKLLLIGVSYALLDFVAEHRFSIPGLIVMETGGMKGRHKEITREELHGMLCAGFGVEAVHSEYGMTELLSQAYSKGHGLFHSPPWMKVMIRDRDDPLSWVKERESGGISIVDLANLHSCSFIATQDLGRLREDGFEVLGRFDHSDARGCNLMLP
ncbi:MAG TPA: acyltransferase [Bacteroidales bacterium]|nr:acyltransferase [Bacteroidales bacterium]HSA44626.1 acyltransferase [Bacteroidales bacterium]